MDAEKPGSWIGKIKGFFVFMGMVMAAFGGHQYRAVVENNEPSFFEQHSFMMVEDAAKTNTADIKLLAARVEIKFEMIDQKLNQIIQRLPLVGASIKTIGLPLRTTAEFSINKKSGG